MKCRKRRSHGRTSASSRTETPSTSLIACLNWTTRREFLPKTPSSTPSSTRSTVPPSLPCRLATQCSRVNSSSSPVWCRCLCRQPSRTQITTHSIYNSSNCQLCKAVSSNIRCQQGMLKCALKVPLVEDLKISHELYRSRNFRQAFCLVCLETG